MSAILKTSVLLIALLAVVWAISRNIMVNTSSAAQTVNFQAPRIDSKQWLNSRPLSNQQLKGKVFLVEFWTFGCYNCVNVEPYVKQWYEKYNSQGFEIIAVHSPEFDHERKLENVQDYVNKKQIKYPVAIDNDYAIWKRFNNRYWPAMYLVDKQGVVRYAHFGEGRYATTEKMIKTLLEEAPPSL